MNQENKKTSFSEDTAEKNIEWYRQELSRLEDDNRNLQNQNYYLQEAYNSVAGAFFWKLTKPLRKISDFAKRILKKIPFAKKIWHALKCLKRNGLKYTLRRIFKGRILSSGAQWEACLKEQRDTEFENPIVFSILVPVYRTNPIYFREMVQSVINQTYSHWELILGDGSGADYKELEEIVRAEYSNDSRIKYFRLEKNEGISGNTNACAKKATGEYIGFLDHDDILNPSALFMNAMAIRKSNADILYSDEDHLSPKGVHCHPFYKPDWSPDLLYSQMYTCHFGVFRRSLFEDLGGLRSGYDGSQDYDFMLRASSKTQKICHIPMVLYSWRECEGSTAANADAKPYAHEAGRRALDDFLKKKYGETAGAGDGQYTFVFDARFGGLEKNPKISVIIPMKDHFEMTDGCIRSILEKTTYQNYELLILDNRSEKSETFEWFEKVKVMDSRIRIIKADMPFNWSKINNFGMTQASGDVFVFLNNDTLIISPDWLERLAENALRPDIGVVGALLLYEDGTIQHSGVVLGLGGYADHIFKGMQPIHFGAPFVSPVISRNTLAVTGACMAVSRKTIDSLGGFDESFEICGSDVELCIRAYEAGLVNRMDANVKLFHLESKSRDSYIPPIDFMMSRKSYKPYLENGDPFFNLNLSLESTKPQEALIDMNLNYVKKVIKHFPPMVAFARRLRRELLPSPESNIPEIGPILARKDENERRRMNLLVPSVDIAHVFGGISTAVKLFEKICSEMNCDVRIITTDADVSLCTSTVSAKYVLTKACEDSDEPYQLVAFNDRFEKTIPVRKNDIFVATAWWTAYTISNVIEWQKETYGTNAFPLLYFIQDYEPGFYPWSSRYMLADSTYRLSIPTYAIMNSGLLRDFFENNGYHFTKTWSFEPVLNEKLAALLPSQNKMIKKKQILVYGRPSVDRNAFGLLVEALKLWREMTPDATEWEIYSAGEEHSPVDLGGECKLESLGKLSIEQYAQTMLDTYAGVSLMVSPHPSYPPLEMSTFGIRTITNCYGNKDLSSFNDNMICLANCSPKEVANALNKVCQSYEGTGCIAANNDYAKGGSTFGNVEKEVAEALKNF